MKNTGVTANLNWGGGGWGGDGFGTGVTANLNLGRGDLASAKIHVGSMSFIRAAILIYRGGRCLQ